MKTKLLLLGFLAIIAISGFAQDRTGKFGVGLSGCVYFGKAQLDDEKLNSGFGLEHFLHNEFLKNIGAYSGSGSNRLVSDNSSASVNTRFEESGYMFKYRHPGLSRLIYNSLYNNFLLPLNH